MQLRGRARPQANAVRPATAPHSTGIAATAMSLSATGARPTIWYARSGAGRPTRVKAKAARAASLPRNPKRQPKTTSAEKRPQRADPETTPATTDAMPPHIAARRIRSRASRSIPLAIGAIVISGCASTAVERNFERTQQFSRKNLGAEVRWLTSDEARRQAQIDVDARLGKPLSADDAVQIALAYSPALQAMLYEGA